VDTNNQATDPEDAPYETHLIEVNLAPEKILIDTPVETTSTSITITWSSCIDEDFENYTIFASSNINDIGEVKTSISSRSENTYSLEGLSSDTNYYITLRTYDRAGQYTDSNTIEATTLSKQNIYPMVIGISIIAIISIIYYLGKTREIDLKDILKGLTKNVSAINIRNMMKTVLISSS
jgi:hypothetical protein